MEKKELTTAKSIDLLDGFWDRVYEEMHKQNISKLQMAKCCRFDRKTLCRPKKIIGICELCILPGYVLN